jgi:hypothetical protein
MKTFTVRNLRYLRFLLLTVLLAAGSILPAFSQGKDSRGTDFWLMFNKNLSTPQLTLFIASDVNTSGTVEIPGLGFSSPFTVTANSLTPVTVPVAASDHTNGVVDNKGIHVTAQSEVTVYGLNYAPFTTDAYLGLPTDVLGTDYVVLTYSGQSMSEFGIVGTQNGTTVTITQSEAAAGHPAGTPYTITLNQGETYEVSFANDLTGTIITSDKPVGVMGANGCANIPPGYAYCDHINEMIPPTTTWGRKFATVPLKSRTNGDTFRFMATEDGTTITVNGGAPSSPLNRGQYSEMILTNASVIESNKPILVAQYANGSTFSGNPGDPFMMLIPPLEQFLPKYTVTTVNGYVAHFINIVAPNSIVGSLTLDGAAVPAGSFTPIGASGFSGAQLSISEGIHNLSGSLAFGVWVYGFNNDDSYGYPGGQSFSAVATVSKVTVDLPNGTEACINQQFCLSAVIKDQNDQPIEGVRVDFNITGANAQTGFAFTGANGVAQFCYTGTNEGMDNITASVGSVSDQTQVNWKKCNGECTPPTFLNNLQIVLDASECGNDGNISIIPLSGTAPFMYSIDGGATYVPGGNAGHTFQELAAGTYQLRLKDANGCESAVVTREVRPNVYPCNNAPCTPPTFLNNSQIVLDASCNGGDGAIYIIPTSGTAPFMYSIDGGATYVSGPNAGYAFQNLSAGTYQLRLKDSKGCESAVVTREVKANAYGPCAIQAVNPRLRSAAMDNAEVRAYPNPSRGQFQVQLKRFGAERVQVQILDARGSVVQSRQVNAAETNTVDVNLSGKAKGLYLIRVVGQKGTQTSKVTIQ